MNIQNTAKKGFTLLELLIVISIIAILSVILIVALNPAETLKKARDTQRIADLASMKTALGIFTTSLPMAQGGTKNLDNNGTICLDKVTPNISAKIMYSSTGAQTCNNTPTPGADAVAGSTFLQTSSCTYRADLTTAAGVTGSGWVPVDFTQIPGGSPISNLPIDPINTASTATPTNATLTYRYACQNSVGSTTSPAYVFEIDTVLESQAYTVTETKMTRDGGDNDAYYEVGTSVKLLPTSSSF